MMFKKQNSPVRLILTAVVCISTGFTACTGGLPDTEAEEYRQAVSDFYVSLAAGQTDELLFAYNKMNSVAEQFPGEPAARANLAVYALRQGNTVIAFEHLENARQLAPGHSDILFLSGLFESRAGTIENAIEYFRRAVAADPAKIPAGYMLVLELERQDDIGNAAEILEQLQRLQSRSPDNLFLIYELTRIAAKYQYPEMVRTWIEQLSLFSGDWPSGTREQLERTRVLAEEEAYSQLGSELVFLRNGLEELAVFRNDVSEVQQEPNRVAFLIEHFLWLPEPETGSAEPDLNMRFTQVHPDEIPGSVSYLGSVVLDREAEPGLFYSENNRVYIDENSVLAFSGSENRALLPTHAITSFDFNYDFRNDLAFAGESGLRVYRQNGDRSFTEVTGELDLPDDVLSAHWHGVWKADTDLDGDLDLMLAPPEGAPLLLQNNGDDTFTPVDLFPEVDGVIDFIQADLNGDGTSDIVFLERGKNLKAYQNMRSGEWKLWEDLPVTSGVQGIAVADTDADSNLDLVVWMTDNRVLQLSHSSGIGSWTEKILFVNAEQFGSFSTDNAGLSVIDADNNGRLDILVTTESQTRLWLGQDSDEYEMLEQELPGRIYTHFDINGNERLDLSGISEDGVPFYLMNSGSLDYGTLSLRAFASGSEGDRRINSFGIGGEMEIRSGLLYQKQLISTPVVHFGLGNYENAEMLRIIWPNGSVQTEFADLGMGSTIFNEQILKGSCPWLFAYDGEGMRFVTDILWRSPLGLRINALETAGVDQTLDRVKVDPEMLQARNGMFDLRITAELWETHFFDYTELVAVDHPAGTEVFIDERFAFPSPDLGTRLMGVPRSVSRVLDDKGNDVSDMLREVDQNYLRTFGKTRYQGLVEDHYLEIDLGDDPPRDGTLWLVASGWLRPTDSSINLALSQNGLESPGGLRIEVSDGRGGWKELHDDYGIPAGKLKTILIDLEGVFPNDADRRIRMHTTSEIYWDAIRWAKGESDNNIRERPLKSATMELRYRGYSDWDRETENSPMLPDYSVVSGTTPRWRDLVGYHTRFGDVGELLEKVDDRYVIMNAGDELVLRFEEIEDPPEGWTRSYLFVSDGWEKDGDYNTQASKTVLPLPYHGQQAYASEPAGSLYNDPVYQMFREDWTTYHTRYITPVPFQQALTFGN